MKAKIFIAGDSTAAIKSGLEKPMTGWGEYLYKFVGDNYEIRNYAVNGRSTKSFINEGRLKQIQNEISKGDYLLIQFRHNDQKIDDLNRYADVNGEYKLNLEKFIDVAVNKGAKPILLTSVTRRMFLDKKLIENTIGEYPKAMKEISQKLNVELLDVYSETWKLLSSLGENDSKKLFLHLDKEEYPNYINGLEDNTHFSEYGANKIAKIVGNLFNKC